MTGKRYKARPETVSYIDNVTGEILRPKYEMGYYKVLDRLNKYDNEYNKLKKENEQLKNDVKRYSLMINTNSDLNDEIYEQLKKTEKNYKLLLKENTQLKERNQRQSKHLAELYELMAKKDWEALTEIIDELCSCEEQLQKEWECYE